MLNLPSLRLQTPWWAVYFPVLMHFLLKQQAEGLVAGLPGFHNKTRPIAVLKTRPIAFQGGVPW